MRNIVVLCFDSVRKDYYDIYAPHLRELADLSLPSCHAASSWSTPSHASMLSGSLPHEHGIHTYNRDYADLPVEETLFVSLPDHKRIGVSSNVFAGPAFNFDHLFDEFQAVPTARRFPEGLDPSEYISPDGGGLIRNQLELLSDAVGHEQSTKSIANAVGTYADSLSRRLPIPRLFDGGTNPVIRACNQQVRQTTEPYVLFVNFMEAHVPMEPTIGYDETLYDAPNTFTTHDKNFWDLVGSVDEFTEYLKTRRALYGASIDYLDRKVPQLIESLQAESSLETTILLTADHGENLGYDSDGRLVQHKSSLSEGVLHVPCDIVNPPDGATAPSDRFTTHLDFKTLLPALATDEFPDIGRETIPAEVVGLSAGPDPGPEQTHWDRAIRALLHENEKYVRDTNGRSVRHNLDPDRPSWQSEPVEIDSLPSTWSCFFPSEITDYRHRVEANQDGADVSAAVERRLEDLGYH